MSNRIAQSIRDNRLFDAILSEPDRKVVAASQRAIDPSGAIIDRAAKPFRTPLAFNWDASSFERQRAVRAGTAILMAVHSVTPPSTGQLVVRLYQETATSGLTAISTIYVPSGTKMFDADINVPILAGSWLSVDIISSGSAADVSVCVTVNVG